MGVLERINHNPRRVPSPECPKGTTMITLRQALSALALASTLTLTACSSGQDNTPPAPSSKATASQAAAPISGTLTADQVSVQLTLQGTPTVSADGQWVNVTVNLANNGKTTLTSTGTHPVNLGAHSADANGKVINLDLARAPIPNIAPGSQAAVTIQLPVSQMSGKYAQILPVQEGVAWFDTWGTKPLTVGPFANCSDNAAGKICDAAGNPLKHL